VTGTCGNQCFISVSSVRVRDWNMWQSVLYQCGSVSVHDRNMWQSVFYQCSSVSVHDWNRWPSSRLLNNQCVIAVSSVGLAGGCLTRTAYKPRNPQVDNIAGSTVQARHRLRTVLLQLAQ
jgi:hypothetical protein